MESIKLSVPVDKLADVKAYAAKIGGVSVTESLGEDVSGETVVVTLEGSDPINVDEVKAFAEKRCDATDEAELVEVEPATEESWDNLDWPDVKDEPKYDPEDPMNGDDFWD